MIGLAIAAYGKHNTASTHRPIEIIVINVLAIKIPEVFEKRQQLRLVAGISISSDFYSISKQVLSSLNCSSVELIKAQFTQS